MNHAAAGRHPLHVARTQHVGIAERVAMLVLAGEHVRHGLEAAMRMIGRAERGRPGGQCTGPR